MKTNCKLPWCKVGILSVKQLLIGAYYDSKEEDTDSPTELMNSMNKVELYMWW